MPKVAPEKPKDGLPSPESTLSYLKVLLSQIEDGHRFGLQERDLDAFRKAIHLRLEDFDGGPQSGVQMISNKPKSRHVPAADKGRGFFPEVNVSPQTANIIDRHYSGESWEGPHRASICILAALIDCDEGDGVSIKRISQVTGYSPSTIKTEFTTMRSMRGLGIRKQAGTIKYRFEQ